MTSHWSILLRLRRNCRPLFAPIGILGWSDDSLPGYQRTKLPTGANYQREQTRWRSPALLALQACRLLFFVHRSIAGGFFTRNESHEIPQKKFFAAISWPFGRELGSQTDIGAAMDPIRAPGNPLWQMFGTRTALPENQRETDVGRVCVFDRMFSPVQMAPRLIRSWLEEGEDLRLILEIPRCLFSF